MEIIIMDFLANNLYWIFRTLEILCWMFVILVFVTPLLGVLQDALKGLQEFLNSFGGK